MANDSSIHETENKSVPGLIYLQQAAARSVCRYNSYECRSPRCIVHTRVVVLATLDYFTLCLVIDSRSTTYYFIHSFIKWLLLFSTYSL